MIIGISAGGYGATLIASHHPSVYSVIESWSGYFQATNPAGHRRARPRLAGGGRLGRLREADPTPPDAFGPSLSSTHYSFYVGNGDTRFLQTNEAIAKELRAYHIPNVTFSVYAGGHRGASGGSTRATGSRRALQHAAKPTG